MKKAKWQKPLTVAEIRHIREMGCRTLAAFKRTAEQQKHQRIENDFDPRIEPCWECRGIARKLGLDVGC